MKKAFTMLELVFVIVVIGILAAAILPRMDRDTAAEATIKLQSDIRYAQHLALVDDKYNANNANWFRNRWQIRFNGNSYSITSMNNNVFARDPETGNNITVNLNNEYGAVVNFAGGCNANAIISFDHLGRPMIGDLSGDILPYPVGRLLTNNCIITVTADGTTETITIFPETGYVQGI